MQTLYSVNLTILEIKIINTKIFYMLNILIGTTSVGYIYYIYIMCSKY